MGWVMFIGFAIELGGLGAAAYSQAMPRTRAVGEGGPAGAALAPSSAGRAKSRRTSATSPARVRQRSSGARGQVRRRALAAAKRARALVPERERWSWIGLALAAFGLLLQGVATWATWD